MLGVKLDPHPVAGHHVLAEAVALRRRSQCDVDFEQFLDGVIIRFQGHGQRSGAGHDREVEEVLTRHMERRPGVTQKIAALDAMGRRREPDPLG